jgi:FkbM family methyltransferase
MKRILKSGFLIYRKLLKHLFLFSYNFLNLLPRGRFGTSDGLDEIFGKTTQINLDLTSIEFHSPNWITRFRAKSILSKEPETVAWINSMEEGSVLWDIGANVGTFSIIAASRKINVVAVEPSFMNIELLNRNVISNEVTDFVTVIPIGLGSKTAIEDFFMTSSYFTWGGAHNSLGSNVGAGGKSLKDAVKTQAICFSLDQLIEVLDLPSPQHLKIDVDGLEVEVLKGAANALKKIKTVLVEVDSQFSGHVAGVEVILKSNGLSKFFSGAVSNGSQNQIWRKQE